MLNSQNSPSTGRITEKRQHQKRRLNFVVRGLGALLVVLGLLGQAQPATAQVPSATAAQATSPQMGIESCGGVIAAVGGNAFGMVSAAISSPYCGAWLGRLNASATCWASRQWWGWRERAIVTLVTWGRYSRC